MTDTNYYQQLVTTDQTGQMQQQQYPIVTQQYVAGPPQYMPPQQYGQEPQVVVGKVNLPTNLNDYSGEVLFHCPMCNQEGVSLCKYEKGSGTYCCSCMLCMLGCIPCFLPYYIDGCKDRIQSCRNCSKEVGRKNYKACSC